MMCHSEPPSVQDAIEDLLFEELEELAALAASYWRSLAEAARRRETMTVAVHFRQARLTAFAAHQLIERLRP